MSGGSLNYFYHTFEESLASISKEIKWGKNIWTPETLLEFQNAIKYMKIAQIYAHRVEWLLDADDSEDTFHKRLNEELAENERNPGIIEPQLKKCSLCENFNGKECKNFRNLSYRYFDHPEWEEINEDDED